jgi:hypothetical protein
VLLNTLRHHDRPYGDHGQISSVDFDESGQRLRMEYVLASRSETYDPSATHALRKHALVAKPTVRDSHAASYCIGVMSEDGLTLVPVSSVLQVRPSFDHVDAEAASRKPSSKSEDSTGVVKPLTGKSLHYQQLVNSIRGSKTGWRPLDLYEFDSVEAADLLHKHLVVSSKHSLHALKATPLTFRGDQNQYLTSLSAGTEKEEAVSSSSWSGGASSHSASAGIVQDLARLDFSKQIETFMRRLQIVKFSELLHALPPNTRARHSQDEILWQLDQCAICIQGNWVVLSHLSSFRPQTWDTRDALLILLHAGREVTVQLLSGINNLNKDEIEELVRSVCVLDLLSNTWKLKLKPDAEFASANPEILKRHEAVAASIINRLKVKKEKKTEPSTGSFSEEELGALSQIIRSKLQQEGSLTSEEVRHALQAKTRDHFVSEATALEVLRLIEAVPVRDRWAAQSRGNDEFRRILMTLFRDRDALTKAEIVAAFGAEFNLTDHDLRKLIKEFARNEKGYWVFNGAMIAERRLVKQEEQMADVFS